MDFFHQFLQCMEPFSGIRERLYCQPQCICLGHEDFISNLCLLVDYTCPGNKHLRVILTTFSAPHLATTRTFDQKYTGSSCSELNFSGMSGPSCLLPSCFSTLQWPHQLSCWGNLCLAISVCKFAQLRTQQSPKVISDQEKSEGGGLQTSLPFY